MTIVTPAKLIYAFDLLYQPIQRYLKAEGSSLGWTKVRLAGRRGRILGSPSENFCFMNEHFVFYVIMLRIITMYNLEDKFWRVNG